MNEYDFLLFDVNNIYHRAFKGDDKIATVYNNSRLETQGIYGSITRIQNQIDKYLKKDGQCYFLFDNPITAQKRAQSINPEYKSNRRKESKQFYRGLDYLEFILRNYKDNSFIVREQSTEADDWVKVILESLNLKNSDKKALMISTDLDWARSLTENTHWYSFYNKKIFSPKEFKEHYSFEVSEHSVIFFKCFYGDDSDNIIGRYKQISPVKFRYVIDNFKNMKEFLQACREKTIPLFNEAIYTRIERERFNLTNNWELISYKPITKVELSSYIVKTKVNLLKLTTMYKGLSLPNSIDKRTIGNEDVMNILFEKKMTKRK